MRWGLSLQYFMTANAVASLGASLGTPFGLSSAHARVANSQVNEAPCVAPLCSADEAAPDFERSFEGLAQVIGLGISGAILVAILLFLLAALSIRYRRMVRGGRILREERDAALEKAAALEALCERDPLTGLLNRRVVEERFATLRAQGFDTFALIDLDKFKAVNDRYGHQVGDDVLVACGDALNGGNGRDYLTMRLGGEEFVVLLRGVDAYYRAEALRKSIPLRIGRSVPALEEPVTASMGLVELPSASHDIMSFSELYSRADALLYNAKASGRDRMCFERLTVFKNAPPVRNSEASAA